MHHSRIRTHTGSVWHSVSNGNSEEIADFSHARNGGAFTHVVDAAGKKGRSAATYCACGRWLARPLSQRSGARGSAAAMSACAGERQASSAQRTRTQLRAARGAAHARWAWALVLRGRDAGMRHIGVSGGRLLRGRWERKERSSAHAAAAAACPGAGKCRAVRAGSRGAWPVGAPATALPLPARSGGDWGVTDLPVIRLRPSSLHNMDVLGTFAVRRHCARRFRAKRHESVAHNGGTIVGGVVFFPCMGRKRGHGLWAGTRRAPPAPALLPRPFPPHGRRRGMTRTIGVLQLPFSRAQAQRMSADGDGVCEARTRRFASEIYDRRLCM